ncbi:MAG: prolyl oligopeptidase family serine peptidase [Candidatus Krumholzibacteria bacterium]|nr:prolyl oligopeptidase family serine peptidase [Candidatus Krumholzibacteria bacterium]
MHGTLTQTSQPVSPPDRRRTASIAVSALAAAALTIGAVWTAAPAALAQEPTLTGLATEVAAIREILAERGHTFDILQKQIDDLLWFERVGDVALIDKVRLWGPPKWREPSATAIGAGQPLKFWAYIFIPRDSDRKGKSPLLVFPHGGVHGDFTTYYTHIVRELLAQGYVIVAPEYRGSTGYGRGMYESIDYGGLETEDAHTCRAYMLENYSWLDPDRVGMIGWSHGGLISLLNVFNHPKDYAAAYAGVPVSDLIARLGYLGESYAAYFSADYHIGQTIAENIAEYRRRSPAWNAEKLQTPLLVYTNKGDEDVNVLEVEHLIKSLKAAGKDFTYEIFDLPGGHSFDRLDTRQAQEIRLRIYRFLAQYLKPPRTFKNVQELHAAGYRS